MKFLLILPVLIAPLIGLSQSGLPLFLEGTWAIEQENGYEHWDRLSENRLKGISYSLKDREIIISEYLDIGLKAGEIVYTATVVGQNQGGSIDFKLTGTDSTFAFENPAHDFPKEIVYKKLSDTEVFVQVSDGKQKGFSYKMKKQRKKL